MPTAKRTTKGTKSTKTTLRQPVAVKADLQVTPELESQDKFACFSWCPWHPWWFVVIV